MSNYEKARELLLDALLLVLIVAVLVVTFQALRSLQAWERAALEVVERELR